DWTVNDCSRAAVHPRLGAQFRDRTTIDGDSDASRETPEQPPAGRDGTPGGRGGRLPLEVPARRRARTRRRHPRCRRDGHRRPRPAPAPPPPPRLAPSPPPKPIRARVSAPAPTPTPSTGARRSPD